MKSCKQTNKTKKLCEFCDDVVGSLFTKTIMHIGHCLYDFSGRIVTKTALDFEKNQVHYLVITAQARTAIPVTIFAV
jgi:hypothetical protein